MPWKVAWGLDVVGRPRIDAEGVVAREVMDFAVVDMHMVAGRDVSAREADDLAVAQDGARL